METLMLKTTVTRFLTGKLLLFLALTLFTFYSASAGFTEPGPGDEIATVRCLKVENNQLFFVVKFDNAGGEKFDVLVNDEYGENLYRGVFKDTSFQKIFRAPADLGKLVIIIRTPKDKDYHKFEVKAATRVVRQAYVKRM